MAAEAIMALRSADEEQSEVAEVVWQPEVTEVTEARVAGASGGLMSVSVSREVDAGFPLSIDIWKETKKRPRSLSHFDNSRGNISGGLKISRTSRRKGNNSMHTNDVDACGES